MCHLQYSLICARKESRVHYIECPAFKIEFRAFGKCFNLIFQPQFNLRGQAFNPDIEPVVRELGSQFGVFIFFPIFLLTALSLVLLAYAERGWMLLLSGFILGVGFGNFQSVGQAVSLSLVSRSRFAQATTTFFIFFDFGIGLGPYLFGFLVPIVGYNGMYLALSGTVLCALVIYYILHGKHMYEMK